MNLWVPGRAENLLRGWETINFSRGTVSTEYLFVVNDVLRRTENRLISE